MSDLTGAYAICDNVKKVQSRGVTQIIIELPQEFHKEAVQMFDGLAVWLEPAPKNIKTNQYCILRSGQLATDVSRGTQQKYGQKNSNRPYSDEAQQLFKSGFLAAPPVLQVIGSDQQYRDWLRGQPCIVSGGYDWDEDEGRGFCIPCHVRRASNSGIGMKPDYSCVPMVNKYHTEYQHQNGELSAYMAALQLRHKPQAEIDAATVNEAKAWFDRKRDEHVRRWASEQLKQQLSQDTGLDYEHWYQIPPDILWTWAYKAHISNYLPACYRPNNR